MRLTTIFASGACPRPFVRALTVSLLATVFVACGDDAQPSNGGRGGSSGRAGSGGATDVGGSSAIDAGASGRPVAGGSSGTAGDGGAPDGEAGAAGEAAGGASDGGAGGAIAGGGAAGGSTAGGSAVGGTGGGGAGNVSSITGVPCSVATTLTRRCNVCHSDPPVLDAPFALTTYDALTEHADDLLEVVDQGLMPPSPFPPLPAAEKAALLAWLEADLPTTNGACP